MLALVLTFITTENMNNAHAYYEGLLLNAGTYI